MKIKGKYGSEASRAAYASIVQDLLAGREVSGSRQAAVRRPGKPAFTVSELCRRYSAHANRLYVKNGQPTGEGNLVSLALKELAESFGDLSAIDFGPLALRSFRDGLIARGLARSTVNSKLRRIRLAFGWAVADELIPPSVLEALRAVAGLRAGQGGRETPPVEPVDDATVEATLPKLPSVVADMVRLQRLTGMRPGEVLSLRPCDVDRSGEVWVYRPASHKTEHHGRVRTVFIGPKAQSVLLRYLARGLETNCFRPCDSEAKRLAEQHAARMTPLSCGNRPGTNRTKGRLRALGERYTAGTYRQAIHRACSRAGVPKWSPNQLRHAAATEARREGGLEAAQVLLGHANAKMSERYAEKNVAAGEAIARRIG